MVPISICMTIKNRARFMQDKLDELAGLTYDPKSIEVCVTDGYSEDNLVEILKRNAKRFQQIKYAISNRDALPFKVPENNPACDINAQVCNVASHEIIIRTDAEVRFRRKDSLALAVKELMSDKELCYCFRSWHMPPTYVYGRSDPQKVSTSAAAMSFHCSCFWKEAFIKNGGVDEAFAKGFAAEDSYFHRWWRKNRHFKNNPAGHEVLHLWHGKWQSDNRLRLKHDYSLPLYKKYLAENYFPNKGNPDWQRPEMIEGVEIWQSQ